MWLQVLLSLVILVGILLYVIVRKHYSYFRDRGIIFVPPKFPLGNMQSITSWATVHKFTHEMYNQFRGQDIIGGYFTFTSPEVCLMDLDVIQDVLVNDFKSFPDHGMYYNEQRDPLSIHLYALSGERWRNMRTKLSPAFSQQSISNMFEAVFDVNTILLEYVDHIVAQGQSINAKDMSMRYICDSIGSVAFGLNTRAMEDEEPELLKLANRLLNPTRRELLAYMATYAYPRLADYIPWVSTPAEVQKYFKTLILETVRYREANNIRRNDFMDLLIGMKNNGCLMDDESGEIIGNITMDELVSNAYVLFFIGFHNCRVTLTFALFELAGNQDIQAKARAEIYRVIGPEGELSNAKLEAMPYIQQIVYETLRKYPPTAYTERKAREDYVLKKGRGHIIERGTPVIIPTFGVHSDPDIYPQPGIFDPDRMTKEKMQERHPAAFLAWGAGPRTCPGHRFAYLLVKMALVNLLGQYSFSINSRTRQSETNILSEFSTEEDIWLDARQL